MKRYYFFFILLLLVFQTSGSVDALNNSSTEDNMLSSLQLDNDINSGSIGSLSYSYGYKTVDQTFDVKLTGTRNFDDEKSASRQIERTINLIVGINIVDVYWQRSYNKSAQNPTSEWVLETGLKTNGTGLFGAWYRYNLFLTKNNGSMWWQGMYAGGPFTPTYPDNATITEITSHTIDILDLFQNKLSELVIPEYKIRYFVDNTNETVFEEWLTPIRGLGGAKVEPQTVIINESVVLGGSLSYSYDFDKSYTWTRSGHFVEIKGTNYQFNYFSVEEADFSYQVDSTLDISGNVFANLTRDIKFKANNTAIPSDMIPLGWRSNYVTASGTWNIQSSDDGTLVSAAALQAIVQAMLTVKDPTNQLFEWAGWGIYRPNRMIGYVDQDADDMLSLIVNGTALQTSDGIKALGIPEGSKLAGSRSTTSDLNFHSYWQRGNEVLVDLSVDQSGINNVNYNYIYGFDPTTSNYDVLFNWKTPSENSGIVDFSWDVEYTNMPTSWWIVNGTSNVVAEKELMNFKYGYELNVDQGNGKANLASTYYQSSVNNQTLKELLDGVSMATYERDAFLTIGTLESDDVSGTVSEPTTTSSFMVGSEPTFESTFSGTKEKYKLAGLSTTYNSLTNSLFVLTGEGSSTGIDISMENPFASPLGSHIVMGLSKVTMDGVNNNLSWKYLEAFVTTSYPTWNGDSIEHDPQYSVSFKSEVTTPGDSKTPTGSATYDFTVFLYSGIFIGLIVIYRKNKSYKNFN